MEIGIISDTHGLVRPQVYKALEGVDMILHAGDIGGMDVIIELEAIAPVKAVLGNNDWDLSGRFQETLVFDMEDTSFKIQHQVNPPKPLSKPVQEQITEIVIFGHSHKPLDLHMSKTLYFNPGSSGPRRFKLPVTLGRMKLDQQRVERKIIQLEA